MPSFSKLPLPAPLLEALGSLGFTQMLPVQAQSLPAILSGRDVLAQAETGSGKTVAFGLGMLARLEPRLDVQALALCPTRELAEQVGAELRKLASRTPNVKVLTLCGGVPFAPQRASLKQGAHVIVGTPGRVEEHLRKASLGLSQLKVLVLDEADRMLDMGFAPQIASILKHVPAARQTLLFSATYPRAISELSRSCQRDAERVEVAGEAGALAQALPEGQAAGALEQRFFRVPSRQRLAALTRWLAREQPASALVFCNTRLECSEVEESLRAAGWVAASIHGDLSQRERTHVMRLFAAGSCSILAATDVAARGWDIPDLPLVINLGLVRDPTVHLHRVGRTARLGRAGLAVSFVSDEDAAAFAALERAQGQQLELQTLGSDKQRAAAAPQPLRTTLILNAGKNKKLRAGDILGALTGEGGLAGSEVGLIHIDDSAAYVAVASGAAQRALKRLHEAGIKGRSVKARIAGVALREPAPEQ
jgi:ATP-dependent RNA helicase DbpA